MEYKISIDKVVDIYTSLCPGADFSAGRVFCRTSAAVLESWLDSQKVTPGKDFEICYAAAAMANYRRALKNGMSAADFKAGDISVESNVDKEVAFAEKLYRDALDALGDCLKSRRFAFLGVKG